MSAVQNCLPSSGGDDNNRALLELIERAEREGLWLRCGPRGFETSLPPEKLRQLVRPDGPADLAEREWTLCSPLDLIHEGAERVVIATAEFHRIQKWIIDWYHARAKAAADRDR
jgi:hypothetical protein